MESASSNRMPMKPPERCQIPTGGEIIDLGNRRYMIGNQIGEGHFGTVYACLDEWGNELVAKIILPRGRSYVDVRDSWLKEMQILMALRHPNITYIYDAFDYKDTFYIIIEKCGSTLQQLITMPNLDGSIWLPSLAGSVLQAVHFIHSQGLVHKDLHPGNVFLVWQKDRMVKDAEPVLTYKVGDLGISNLEQNINVWGTVMAEWMLPPEYLDPTEFGLIDRRVDIYHIGLLFLGLLSNKDLAFSREDVLGGQPRLAAERLVSPFGPAIARALRRHVKDRTPTALDLWHDIRAACPNWTI